MQADCLAPIMRVVDARQHEEIVKLTRTGEISSEAVGSCVFFDLGCKRCNPPDQGGRDA